MTTATAIRIVTQADAAPAAVRGCPASPLDAASVAEVVQALPTIAQWPPISHAGRRLAGNTAKLLDWLQERPGDGWQARWQAAEQKYGAKWLTWPVEDANRTGRDAEEFRREMTRGLGCLLKLRLIKPSYAFLAKYAPTTLFTWTRSVVSPDLFARAEQTALLRGVNPYQVRAALNVLTAITIHLGGQLHDITETDMLAFQEAVRRPRSRAAAGAHTAWQMLVDLGLFPAGTTLHAALQTGPLPTAQLIERYNIMNTQIRELLIRYLDERRPALDYNTFRGVVGNLVGRFWADIERHHPHVTTIDLPGEVAQAWKDRVRAPQSGRAARHHWDVFITVRAFYLDIAEWALSDPSWAPWAFPSPVRKTDTMGAAKNSRARTAAMHQRVRERLPHLLRLVDSAQQWKNDRAELLDLARHVATGATIEHAGVSYLRIDPVSRPRPVANHRQAHVMVERLADGALINLTIEEDEAFWAWAVIETLRHTGVRIEELLELTQLAIVSHRLADTGELVPLLQIVPSKTNEERLLLVTPELASVLAAIISRIRTNDGTVPLVARYDNHERVTGPALPHLFQHRDGFQHQNGWRNDVLHPDLVRDLLTRALARAGITDVTGQPLHYTPHDFRRMFATEAVTAGLPVHIAARILGHCNLNTIQAYTAVFQEELIRTYRTFIDRRRALRPTEEYREPTEAEWTQFQQHFHQRKLELGDCGRPYGTPCAHEHACVRCPMLRVDPQQRHRLIAIVRNLTERIREAKDNAWHGDVEGLTVSLKAAENKLVSLDRAARNQPGPLLMGVPTTRAKEKQ